MGFPLVTAPWLVSPIAARNLVREGATLLDARGHRRSLGQGVQGAIGVHWRQFSPPHLPDRGKLLSDAVLTQVLQTVGIRGDRPVVVVGDAQAGWGEEGRIVWMLRTLGHPMAMFVDGGYAAWLAVGYNPPIPRATVSPEPDAFIPIRTDRWAIDREQLRARLDHPHQILLDVREKVEYAGATLHGERRGGHLPGARSLPYRTLRDARGHRLPTRHLRSRLQAIGVRSDSELVVYCTGGIRSAWVTAVLTDLGFAAKNYAGSIWEWAAGDAEVYPLVVSE